MKKDELVHALIQYAHDQKGQWRGQNVLAAYFGVYFGRLTIPADEKYDFWEIEPYVAQLLVGAMEELRHSDSPLAAAARRDYESQAGHPVSDLMDITGSGIDQVMSAQVIGFLFTDITGDTRIATDIDLIFSAQRHLLHQRALVFVAKVFTRGLSGFIHEGQDRGMSGQFGQTTLRTYWMAGRLMMTLARSSDDESEDEHSLTLICEDDDPLALGIGIQSVFTDLNTALAMIDEVINVWPSNLEDAWMMMAPDDKVGIG